jgi:hypothetical protein
MQVLILAAVLLIGKQGYAATDWIKSVQITPNSIKYKQNVTILIKVNEDVYKPAPFEVMTIEYVLP